MFTVTDESKALREQKEAEGTKTASQEEAAGDCFQEKLPAGRETASQEEAAGDCLQVAGKKKRKIYTAKVCTQVFVYGKKKKKKNMKKEEKEEEEEEEEGVNRGEAFGPSGPVTKVFTMEKAAASGTKEKLPINTPRTPHPRPQDVLYQIVVDSTNEPFKHAFLEKSPVDARPIHPLEKLPVEQLFDMHVPESLPSKPPALCDTHFTFVKDRKTLNELARKLKNATEFAVNIEHNHNRSFQGLTCLMQISTRTEDFIVDTLKLHKYLGEKLRDVFQHPTKKKVMHGAGRDITWLQRDFGIYICNLFDIGQASRILRMSYKCSSLKHLLHHFCGVRAKRRYHSADWRRRPLTDGMTEYAREVTHYLLYIYDLMRLRLVNESSGEDDLLLEVCKCSNEICVQLYEKELLTDSSYLRIHGLKENDLSAKQLSVLAGLYQWRDGIARAEDESTAYILPNKTLLEIAKQTPVTARRIRRTVGSKHKFLEHHLSHVITIVRNAVANSDAFENIAELLKRGSLEELMLADAKSSSEDTEIITAVDANNNESNSHLSDEPAVVPGSSSKQSPFFTRIVDGSSDYSTICGTLEIVLKGMGFDELTVLIKYRIIPFIKSCSDKLWPKLVKEVLDPVFDYLRVKLSKSWRVLLHDGSVQVPDTIPDIFLSKEDADKFGSSLIIQLTRAASELLAVIASPELNGSLDLVCSRSLVRCVLCRDVPRLPVLSLIYYIFGEWKDDEAKMMSVPFCYNVMKVATAEHLYDAVSFVKDSVIPPLIQCLALKSTLNITQLAVLRKLCREAFRCVQDLVSAEKYNQSTDKVFESWLPQQIFRCTNAPSLEPEEFVWTWEVKEEFREYIAAYIDMLHQVNEMEDCLECDYSSPCDLFDKLKPDFKSKYGIDSASHDYVWTMTDILSRKMSSKHWQRQNDEMFQLFCELIDLKPYIQHSSYDSVVELVRNLEGYPGLAEFLRISTLEEFCEILLLWEPQFHPLIRKGHRGLLRKIVNHLTYQENITFQKPLQPDIGDFPVHLQPSATNHFASMNKRYQKAKEQARLHEKFDGLLASGSFDHYIHKDDALKAVLDAHVLPGQFSVLKHGLIKLSFERRAKFLGIQDQLHLYYQCFQDVIKDEKRRIKLQSLIDELDGQGFFCIADDAIDWDNKCFKEPLDKFGEQVFAGFDLPDYYVIRGIMDYRAMSLKIDDSRYSWQNAFEEVVGGACRRWIDNSHLFWMNTRYYEHKYYGIIRQPFEKIWLSDMEEERSTD